MRPFGECISFLLGKAAQRISRRARDALAPYGMTPVQYAVLRTLWDEEGCSAAGLCAKLVIDSATITGIVDRLEAASLIVRRADHIDRRVNRLYLTEPAKKLQPLLDRAIDALNDEVALELGRDAEKLSAMLRQLGTGGE